ncbi:STN domain-containing protein [Pedobacter sp. GR22-6]|uniref:STN domain-containing protein n=1 Tax=Pedobacter sp. GR22-6 TaxID=3127957 RepID=UPI00307EAD20
MKLIIVLMTTCLLQVSAAGFAQKITYTKKGATLEQIFTEIRKQTGYNVAYSGAMIDKNTKMDVNFKATDLTDVLDVVSKSQDLTYSFDEKNISLKPKEKSYLETVIDRFQAIDVKGKVVDSLGNGIGGATINIKGTKIGTTTAANGDFCLKNVDEEALLVVSYLGYMTKEIKVNKDFNYIQLQMSTSKLDEVQVIAYGKTSQRLSTGNVTVVKAEEIERQPVNNPLYALQGRVPGLQITPKTGLAGGAVNLQIRGKSSLNSGTEPLVVVDGLPVTNNITGLGHPGYDVSGGNQLSSLSFINPNDIESISVLKESIALSCQEEG